MTIDRVDWHWKSTEELYRKTHDISGELTDEQQNEIWLMAGNHIGLFLRWIIDNNLQGEDFDEADCEKVRSGLMTGTECLLKSCDGKFWGDDVSEAALPFVKSYYNESTVYLTDYCNCCTDDEDKPLYGVISDEGDYLKLKGVIDKAYNEFQKQPSQSVGKFK